MQVIVSSQLYYRSQNAKGAGGHSGWYFLVPCRARPHSLPACLALSLEELQLAGWSVCKACHLQHTCSPDWAKSLTMCTLSLVGFVCLHSYHFCMLLGVYSGFSISNSVLQKSVSLAWFLFLLVSMIRSRSSVNLVNETEYWHSWQACKTCKIS